MLGVDRLDYTKGIRHRLKAYAELLEDGADRPAGPGLRAGRHPQPRARRGLPRAARGDRAEVGRINGEFGDIGSAAVHYLHHSYPREEMAALFLAADVMLVTPLRDGMNLVAKEYVACRNDGGGALVLSEFAGAWHELHQAYVCNPHDIAGPEADDHDRDQRPRGRAAPPDEGHATPGRRPRRAALGQPLPRGARGAPATPKPHHARAERTTTPTPQRTGRAASTRPTAPGRPRLGGGPPDARRLPDDLRCGRSTDASPAARGARRHRLRRRAGSLRHRPDGRPAARGRRSRTCRAGRAPGTSRPPSSRVATSRRSRASAGLAADSPVTRIGSHGAQSSHPAYDQREQLSARSRTTCSQRLTADLHRGRSSDHPGVRLELKPKATVAAHPRRGRLRWPRRRCGRARRWPTGIPASRSCRARTSSRCPS